MAKINKLWIPLWIDKWLFGSTRIELNPDERSVWLDLLVIASKNEGYIRANENTPYPDSQLAGLLIIPVELLQRTVKKCIKYEKITRGENDTLYVINWKKYQFSDRHKRRVSAKTDTTSEDEDTIKENNIVNNNIKEKKKKASTKKSSKFKPPTIEEIRTYCQKRKNKVDPEQFYNFYESKGWMVGKNKMKNWKACIHTWEKRDGQTSTPPPKRSLITVEAAKTMIARDGTTETMIDIIERLPPDEYALFIKTVVKKDNYKCVLFQRAKKILKKREGQ